MKGAPSTLLETGIRSIDTSVGGLPVGGLTVLAGCPSSGKTSLALTIATKLAVFRGLPVAVFMLEFDMEILQRRLCELVSAASWEQLEGPARQEPAHRGGGSPASMLANAPLHLDDSPALSAAEIRARTTRLLRSGVQLVVVDYLQLVAGDPNRGNREQQLAAAAEDLRTMSVRMQIALMATSQLRRPMSPSIARQARLIDSTEGVLMRPHVDLLIELGHMPDELNQRQLSFERRLGGPSGAVRLETPE